LPIVCDTQNGVYDCILIDHSLTRFKFEWMYTPYLLKEFLLRTVGRQSHHTRRCETKTIRASIPRDEVVVFPIVMRKWQRAPTVRKRRKERKKKKGKNK
jgi:hypothetical protein